MQISGNSLPVLSSQTGLTPNQESAQRSPSQALDQYRDTEQQSRQQTTEYVFRGELLDDVIHEHQQHQKPEQMIDPSRQEAISSYIDTDSATSYSPERQGRLVDIFI